MRMTSFMTPTNEFVILISKKFGDFGTESILATTREFA
jgi:hypothetical protein